jgi:mannose-1-phosphate guanylyltransferase
MIEVPIEVGSGDARFKVLARAQSIRGAIRAVRKRYPGAAVHLVFPLGPEFFFAGAGTEELIELEAPEVAASPAPGKPDGKAGAPVKAMVLAAGKGTRLLPLTGAVPKPMAPVVGKPIIQHIFELLAGSGVEEVHVNLYHLANSILRVYGEETLVDGTKIHFSREEELMGTAGGVKRISDRFDETFVVIMGDALTDIDLRKVVSFHKERKALATLALMPVADTSRYGVVELDSDKNIMGFQEKPRSSEAVSNLANTGIYVLEPEALDFIPENTFFDFAEDVFPRMLEAGEKFVGYDESGFYWSDVGTLEAYREAQQDALAGRVGVKIPGEQRGEGLWVDPDARLHPTAALEGRVVIGRDVVVGRGATLAGDLTVGSGCWVRPGATVKRSILLPGSSVGEGTYLEDCIVGPGYDVRPGDQIRGGALVRREYNNGVSVA